MIIKVKVKPNSLRDEIVRNEDGSYSVWVKERAEDNRANKRLINILARKLGVHFSRIKIKNSVSRNKIIEIKEE